jgi:hypothetical protein
MKVTHLARRLASIIPASLVPRRAAHLDVGAIERLRSEVLELRGDGERRRGAHASLTAVSALRHKQNTKSTIRFPSAQAPPRKLPGRCQGIGGCLLSVHPRDHPGVV